MERGELERMGDSLGPGAIFECTDRRMKETSVDLCASRAAEDEIVLPTTFYDKNATNRS